MAYPVMPLGFLGSQGDNDTYRIERSLRFNSADSAYLNRTFSGTPYTYTFGWWVKRGTLSTAQIMFGSRQGASNPSWIEFQSDNTIRIVLGVNSTVLTTTRVFRDPSAWYHFVLSVTPSATSYFYVNGIQVGSWTSSATPYLFNSSYTNAIGRYGDSGVSYFDGYMTEINFIDGQALTPSSFGETDPITGRWKAKAYSGTYGTNGFYLKFSDNSSLTTTSNVGIGKDFSGNGNYWATNGLSVTAGSGNDSLVDSPTNYGSDTGVGGEVRGNYPTWNPLYVDGSVTFTNVNLDASASGTCRATIPFPLYGKWYCECTANASSPTTYGVGVILYTSRPIAGTSFTYRQTGQKSINGGSGLAYGSSYTTNDVIGIAYDSDAGTVTMYKNNASQGVLGSSLTGEYAVCISGGGGGSTQMSVNFGQRPFAYTAPTGFKALCTTNLTQPTIQKPSTAMDVVTYTGNGSARSITGFGFSPDLVWIKGRSGATDHAIYDSVRGVQLDLASNLTSAETTQSQGVTAFNSDGFNIGTLAKLNTNSATYVAWAWDEAPIAGMDIVSYTGNGANRTIAHNLGIAPKMMIVRNRNSSVAQNWQVYHANLTSAAFRLRLNTTDAQDSVAGIWNSTAPTSSVFSVGTETGINENGKNFIAYLFAEVEGFSKFGSWSGNGSTDGPFIWCGFRPKYVLAKRDAVGKPWMVYDSGRSDRNSNSLELRPNTNEAENASLSGEIDFLSNGFKIRSDSGKWIGELGTFIFAAFAESPFKYARAR